MPRQSFPKRGTRSIGETRGLAPIEAADGMAIIMAASRNQKALDSVPGSSAENGLFTHEFVREIQLPGVDIQTALRRVRDRVETQAARVNNSQRPSLIDETRGSFYFVPGGVAVVRPADVRAEPIVAPARPEPIIAPARPASFSTTGYSKISNNGDLLPESATLGTGANDWACTRDNAKGLMWEVKAAAGMRAMEHTYSWYDSNSKDGSKGTAHGGKCHRKGRCDTEKFVQDVNALGLCGRRDWRMPAIEELKGLEKNSWEPPLIGPVYFPNTPSAHVWSGSPQPGASNGASGVVFSNPGYTYYDVRSKSYSVRLVRSGQ